MSIEQPGTDNDLLDLLRSTGPLSVNDLAGAMEVTPTAIRQRLTRLISQEIIQREASRIRRGRPMYRYWLTDKGLQLNRLEFYRSGDGPLERSAFLRRR